MQIPRPSWPHTSQRASKPVFVSSPWRQGCRVGLVVMPALALRVHLWGVLLQSSSLGHGCHTDAVVYGGLPEVDGGLPMG